MKIREGNLVQLIPEVLAIQSLVEGEVFRDVTTLRVVYIVTGISVVLATPFSEQRSNRT